MEKKILILKIKSEFLHWIHVAQDRGQRRAFVNTVMNLLVP
jgi:hypothetical protein